ncbi:MAG: MATE family efflux transporter, partial [Oscillospiraceae bacterium]|nr:MATE family efflux transporter [Oscillospiraceae bacterium]
MKEFAKYVSFNILGMLGISCYILADTYFIAQWLGADGITALNLVIPAYNFINGLALMLGMGGCTKYMIHMSCQQNRPANQIFTQVLYLWLFLGILLVLTGLFFSDNIV